MLLFGPIAQPVRAKVIIKLERVCARTSEPSADCSASASQSDAKRTAPRTFVLDARKEYNRAVHAGTIETF